MAPVRIHTFDMILYKFIIILCSVDIMHTELISYIFHERDYSKTRPIVVARRMHMILFIAEGFYCLFERSLITRSRMSSRTLISTCRIFDRSFHPLKRHRCVPFWSQLCHVLNATRCFGAKSKSASKVFLPNAYWRQVSMPCANHARH